jgi:hypothetical protein
MHAISPEKWKSQTMCVGTQCGGWQQLQVVFAANKSICAQIPRYTLRLP